MAKYVVGVDGGTGGIRAGLFEIATGEPVGFADTPYETRYPQPGWAEQDPNDWWVGMGSSVRKVLEDARVGANPIALERGQVVLRNQALQLDLALRYCLAQSSPF